MDGLEGLPRRLGDDANGVDHGIDAGQAWQPVVGLVVAGEVDLHHRRARGRLRPVADPEDQFMPSPLKNFRQPPADQPRRPKQQHAHGSGAPRRGTMGRFALRVLASGSLASVSSIAMAALLARRRTGSAASAPNATSHWLWGERAMHRHRADLRHTATGYAIHHASSLFWATFHEAGLEHTRLPASRLAPAISALALAVDYSVVPERLTPGFDRHLSRTGLAAVYAAFAGGLALGSRLARWGADPCMSPPGQA